jgi:hypothetical protein
MLTEARFEDAFGELYLGDEMRSPYDDAAKVILDIRNRRQANISGHHVRYHTRDEWCITCNKVLNTTKDLKRDIDSVHPNDFTQRYYCTVDGCKYSETMPGSAGFTRKDGWKRHLRNRHGLVV